MIAYRLYRQDTQYADGKHVRDLSKLNRDMSQARGGPDVQLLLCESC